MHSYRAKLIVYTCLFMVFLTGSTFYSYHYIQKVLSDESFLHLKRMSQVLISQLEYKKKELQHYCQVITNNLQLKEYLFIVTKVSNDPQPLQDMYRTQFGELPLQRHIIIGSNDKIISGKEHKDLYKVLKDRWKKLPANTFYINGDKGLELVSYHHVTYKDELTGVVAVSYSLNGYWLRQINRNTDGQLFIDYANFATTKLRDTPTLASPKTFVRNHQTFQAIQVLLRPAMTELPEVWFGLPDSDLSERLTEHRIIALSSMIIVMVIILSYGLVVIRNFNRPLSRLIELTREVTDGNFPKLEKSEKKDEFSTLTNHFADMLLALRKKQDEVNQAHAELEQTAITDSLTGLYNRRQLNDVFPKLLAQSRRNKQTVCCALIDLDHFKRINDQHGHLAGDTVLQYFSSQLISASRENDYLFRMGGEEFLILTLSELPVGMVSLAEKIRKNIEQSTVLYEDQEIHFTISSGVSCADPDMDSDASIREMLTRADTALYEAKQKGRNMVITKRIQAYTLTEARKQGQQ